MLDGSVSAGPEDVQEGEPDGEQRARSGRQAKARTGNDGTRPTTYLLNYAGAKSGPCVYGHVTRQ